MAGADRAKEIRPRRERDDRGGRKGLRQEERKRLNRGENTMRQERRRERTREKDSESLNRETYPSPPDGASCRACLRIAS